MELLEKQYELEKRMHDQGVERYLNSIAASRQRSDGRKSALESNTSYGMSLLYECVEPYAYAIKEFIDSSLSRPGRKPEALLVLSRWDTQITAYIAAKTIIDTLSVGVKYTSLALKITQKLTDEAYVSALEGVNQDWYNKLVKTQQETHQTSYTHRMATFRNMGKKAGVEYTRESITTAVGIGSALIQLFKLSTDLIQIGKEYQSMQGKRVACTFVYPTEKAMDCIEDNIKKMQELSPDLMPLVVPPRPWTTPFDGGYHTEQLRKCNPLVHTRSKHQIKKLMQSKFDYSWINHLQDTEWRINKFILSVLEDEAKKPSAKSTIASPDPFRGIPCPIELPKVRTKESWQNWFNKLSETDRKKYVTWKEVSRRSYFQDTQRFSKRKLLGRVLSVAREYSAFDKIYFAYFLDFRGRAYSIGAVNPQGVDYSKALLEPAVAAPLGAEGYKYGQLQLSGLYGVDKCSIADRLTWVAEHHNDILLAANDPLGAGYNFWIEADKPWQFLSACHAWRDIHLQIALGLPPEMVHSRMIATLDGSCNGLQHFSAMLRDEEGGALVNLIPGQVPADIYQRVADVTLTLLKRPQKAEDYLMAVILLKMGITRSTCKRQTMIVPYAGTLAGCKEYSTQWVKEQYSIAETSQDKSLLTAISDMGDTSIDRSLKRLGNFLGKLVWEALGQVVKKSLIVMRFIQNCVAAVAAGSGDSPVGRPVWWTNHNGFITWHEYKAMDQFIIDSKLCGRIRMQVNVANGCVNQSKMRSSAAPNYVHGADASHMSATIKGCYAQGIRFFACVHDSFGTHIGNAATLGRTLREAFIAQYKDNTQLKQFYLELYNQWSEIVHPRIMEFPDWQVIEDAMGSLRIGDIQESTFFFL